MGIPRKVMDFKKMQRRVSGVNKIEQWESMDLLVVDECAMLQAEYLDWLDVHVRRSHRSAA